MKPAPVSVRTGRMVAACGGVGLMLVAVGSFLPWLRSGQVLRNSYAALGVLRRLVSIPGIEGALLASWPLLGLFCAAVAAIFAIGARRIAACIALLPAVFGGLLAAAALAKSRTGTVQVTPIGPVFTLAGALLVIAAVTLLCVQSQAWPWKDDS
jgi:hypothetical protein